MKCSTQSSPGWGHDWVLVSDSAYPANTFNVGTLLWACPCGEFKWTSYAEWQVDFALQRDKEHAETEP